MLSREQTSLPPGVITRTSSVTYSYTSGAAGGGQFSSEYTGSSVLARARGEADVIGQHRGSYRDSSGVERLGVARTLGARGRCVVRGTDASGAEVAPGDFLINTGGTDGSAFDEEWSARAHAIGGEDFWCATATARRSLGPGDRVWRHLLTDLAPAVFAPYPRPHSQECPGEGPAPAADERAAGADGRRPDAARRADVAHEGGGVAHSTGAADRRGERARTACRLARRSGAAEHAAAVV